MGWLEDLIRAIGGFIAIGIALNAKPLGDRPYRWGLYVGVWSGLITLELLIRGVFHFRNHADILGAVVLSTATVLGGLVASGLILRRRWGVVAFIAAYGLFLVVWLSSPRYLSIWRNINGDADFHEDPLTTRLLVCALLAIYVVPSLVYFKRRWQLMGKPGAAA